MPIVGEQFPGFVIEQINQRQTIHGKKDRTINDLVYLNAKTAWVKLASGVSLKGNEKISSLGLKGVDPGMDLAKQYILFGGVSKKSEDSTILQQFEGFTTDPSKINPYNINAKQKSTNLDFGFVPPPGIESAEIKNLNRGSIKKATVKLKAYSRDQFEILDILYMRLGYTVLLEWGWSHYFTNEGKLETMGYTLTEAPNGFFSEEYSSHRQFLGVIQGYRSGKDGNYDGLLAKVSNFEWSFNPDGSYDITLTLVSLGDVIESLKTNVSPRLKDISEEDKPKDVLSEYLFIWKEFNNPDPDNPPNTPKTIYHYIPSATGIGYFIEPDNDKQIFTSFTSPEYDNKTETSNALIKEFEISGRTFKKVTISQPPLVDRLDNASEIGKFAKYLPPKDFDFKSSSTGKFSFQLDYTTTYGGDLENLKDVIYFEYKSGEESEDAEKDSNSNLGYYMRLGHLLGKVNELCIPVNNKNNFPIIRIDNSKSPMLLYPNQISFDPRVCVVRNKIDGYKVFTQLKQWADETNGIADLMSVYVSFSTIQNAIDSNLDERGDLALVSFIQSICTDLNKALGGVNNLEPVVDEETNTLEIIDGSFISDEVNERKYELEVFGYNPSFNSSNFVRNLDLKTTITPEYAAMVTIGATAGGYVKGTEATMFSKWNKGLVDRFQEEYSPPSETPTSTADDKEPEDNYKKYLAAANSTILGYSSEDDSNINLDDTIIDNNLSVVTEYYKYLNYLGQQNNSNFASTSNGFIPFGVGVTMDGLSGIKIYNKLNISTRFLPSNYPESLHFIIKGVSHKISNQDWETSLETIVVPNSSTSS
jgi:hypothetical protein